LIWARAASWAAAVGIAFRELLAQDSQHLRIDLDELVGGLDLAPQRRLLDRGHDHVGSERQVGGLGLKTLGISLRLQRFHRPAILPPHVEGVRHHDLGGVEVEYCGAARDCGRKRARLLLPGWVEICLNGWKELAFLSLDDFLGLPQGGLGRLQIGIGNYGFLNKGIERGRLEQSPPFSRNIATVYEALSVPILHIRRSGGL
jgi:hypothetical protein